MTSFDSDRNVADGNSRRATCLCALVAILAALTTTRINAGTSGKVEFSYSEAAGIGKDKVMRRDPSDIIKAGDLYYVWYSKGPKSDGFDATISYATSSDGHAWTEKGMALAKGSVAGSWDEASVFTPNILVAEGKYWLFFSGISKNMKVKPDTKIGVAVSNSPDGPWERLGAEPILKGGDSPEDFDSHLIDDACLIKRDGKYWLYYKGRQLGKKPTQTKTGVAIADKPGGPYQKHQGNPVIADVHEVLVWPQGKGVAALVGGIAAPASANSIVYAEDGLHFIKMHDAIHVPHAAGAYRPEAFTDSGAGKLIEWGMHIGSSKGSLPFIERFDLETGE